MELARYTVSILVFYTGRDAMRADHGLPELVEDHLQQLSQVAGTQPV